METQTKPEGQKPYKVRKIDQLTRMTDMGEVERYYRHTIKTKGGVALQVDIEESDFTPEKATVILTKKAENADKILAL